MSTKNYVTVFKLDGASKPFSYRLTQWHIFTFIFASIHRDDNRVGKRFKSSQSMSVTVQFLTNHIAFLQAQSDDDDVADDVSVNVGAPDDFMTEFFAEVSDESHIY